MDYIHPFVGLIDHVSVMPLRRGGGAGEENSSNRRPADGDGDCSNYGDHDDEVNNRRVKSV